MGKRIYAPGLIMRDPPLKGAKKRKCSKCGASFKPTMQRRMLCRPCFREGDGDGSYDLR